MAKAEKGGWLTASEMRGLIGPRHIDVSASCRYLAAWTPVMLATEARFEIAKRSDIVVRQGEIQDRCCRAVTVKDVGSITGGVGS